MSSSGKEDSIVFVVDDDDSLRESLADLFRVVGLKVETFASANEFLSKQLPDITSCLILDVRLPGASGLSVQADLTQAGIEIPVIFITAHGDIPMTVKAMKAGAAEFLTKPFRDQDLLDAVQLALDRDRKRRTQGKSLASLKANYENLTSREKEILRFVAAGLMNKQIAARMGIAEITVKIHRGNLTRKMGARTLVELVRMAQSLGIGAQ